MHLYVFCFVETSLRYANNLIGMNFGIFLENQPFCDTFILFKSKIDGNTCALQLFSKLKKNNRNKCWNITKTKKLTPRILADIVDFSLKYTSS